MRLPTGGVAGVLVWFSAAALLLVSLVVSLGHPHEAIAVVVLVAVLLAGSLWPRVYVYATIVLAFTAFPSSVPQTINVHGTGILIYEPTLFAAAVWALHTGRIPRQAKITAAILGGLAVWLCLLGRSNGASLHELILDGRGLVDVAVAVLIAGAVIVEGRPAGVLRTVKLVLWVSGGFVVAASLHAVTLQGSTQAASLTDTQDITGAERFLTPDTFLAVAVCCGVLALYLTRRARIRQLMAYLLPAVVVMVLAFSRNHLLGLAVAALATVVLDRKLLSVIPRLLVAAVVASVVVGVAASTSSYVREQVSGFDHRVVSGLSDEARSTDPSNLYRQSEDRQLRAQIPQHTVIGHGFGIPYQAASGDPGSFTATTGRYYAHQYYLWLWFKGGLVALGLFAVTMLAALRRAYGTRTSLAITTGAVLAGFLAISVYAPLPNGDPTSVLFGAMLGAVCAAGSLLGMSGVEADVPLSVGVARQQHAVGSEL